MAAGGSSVIFTHHHAKGPSGGKASIDRGSGSGVFGRDPDAILDVSPLAIDPNSTAWEFLRSHDYDGREGKVQATALRMSYTLREFASPSPIDLVFRCPIHVADSTGELSECHIIGSNADNGAKGGRAKAERSAAALADTDRELSRIVADVISAGEVPTRAACLTPLNEWRESQGMEPWSENTFAKETKPSGRLSWQVSATRPWGLVRKQ